MISRARLIYILVASAAADERVKVVAPVSGMGDLTFYAGEGGVGRHCDCFFFPNRARWPWSMIAALVCPRPMLFVNSDNDVYFPEEVRKLPMFQDRLRREVPAQRLGTAVEDAMLAVFLASGECRFMVGQTVPLVLVALKSHIVLRDTSGSRTIAADEFFLGPMMTAITQGSCLVEIRFPVWSDVRVGVGFHEISARRSDFALASAAAQLMLDGDGRCDRLAVAVGAVTDFPLRLGRVEQAFTGTRLDPSSVRDAVQDCLAGIETNSDLHASAAYRRRAAVALATRAILDAHADAQRQAHAH